LFCAREHGGWPRKHPYSWQGVRMAGQPTAATAVTQVSEAKQA